MRSLIKDKRGGYTDIFLFIILAVVILLVCGIFVYVGGTIQTKLHEKMDNMSIGSEDQNVSQIIDDTVGKVNVAYSSLRWISFLLIGGMIIAVFIGSYMVTSRPIFFVPYIFIIIIAVVLGAVVSNAYEILRNDTTIGPTLASFTASNFIMANLPIWVIVIGIGGGILMFTRMNKGEEQQYYGY